MQASINSRHQVILNTLALLLISVLSSCRQEALSVSRDDASTLNRWLEENRQTPAELLMEEIVSNQSIIFAQDNLLRADTIDLIRSLVPIIHNLGVREMGLFFLNSENQEELDAFVMNGSDVTRSEKLLFSANPALGYKEYCDLILYVRDFNLSLKSGTEPMRLLALGKNGKTSSEILYSVLNIPDEENDSSEETNPVEPAVRTPVFLWIPLDELAFVPVMDGEKKTAALVIHHGPAEGRLRWNGLIESVNAQRNIRDRTYAFRTDEPPFTSWESEEIGNEADIYIITPFTYRAVEPIPDFITAQTAAQALTFFPDIRIEKPVFWLASRMNRITKRAAKHYQKMVEDLVVPDAYAD